MSNKVFIANVRSFFEHTSYVTKFSAMYLKMDVYIVIISLLDSLKCMHTCTHRHTHKDMMNIHAQRCSLLFCFFTSFCEETVLFFRVVEEILTEFRVRMRLQLMCFGDPKNQQAMAVPGM